MAAKIIKFPTPQATIVNPSPSHEPNNDEIVAIRVVFLVHKIQEDVSNIFGQIRKDIFSGLFMTIDSETGEYRIYIAYNQEKITANNPEFEYIALRSLNQLATDFTLVDNVDKELKISFRCENINGMDTETQLLGKAKQTLSPKTQESTMTGIHCLAGNTYTTASSYEGSTTESKEAAALRDLKTSIIILDDANNRLAAIKNRIADGSDNPNILRLQQIKSKIEKELKIKPKTKTRQNKKNSQI